MKPFQIAASILSADFSRLGKDATQALEAGADRIHFDVMDNHFVPHLTIGPLLCKALRHYGMKAPIDVHLMTERPGSLVEAFAKAGANQITFHIEAHDEVVPLVELIRQNGCQAGLALNPETPVSSIEPYISQVDSLLVMSVQPGRGGQTFLSDSLEKIMHLSRLVEKNHPACQIGVDGGIKIDNIAQVASAGAHILVAGSALFSSADYASTLTAMRQKLAGVN